MDRIRGSVGLCQRAGRQLRGHHRHGKPHARRATWVGESWAVPLTGPCILLLTVWLLAGCAAAPPGTLTDRDGWVMQRTLLPHPQQPDKQIEIFWTTPVGQGPWPAVLFIHGHQERFRDGGAAYVKNGRLGRLASRGYVAAAVSQPGYGHSDGPPDLCGPSTQAAVREALAFLRAQPVVPPHKVALNGYSRGAIVAGMVATQDPQLAAVVLGAGAYDLFRWYPTPVRGLDANIEHESGTSAAAFRARSAIVHVDTITVPILILHGAQDERVPVRQAEAFAETLRAKGLAVTVKIFSHAHHRIPIEAQDREIDPFLEAMLR
jgi:dipeptidyl aminopeptidase/acylaminoacyl peptidase